MSKTGKSKSYGVEYADRSRSWIAERVRFFYRKKQLIDQIELDKRKRELLAKYN